MQWYFLRDIDVLMEIQTWKQVDHEDIMAWNPFPRYLPFVIRIHRSSVGTDRKGSITLGFDA